MLTCEVTNREVTYELLLFQGGRLEKKTAKHKITKETWRKKIRTGTRKGQHKTKHKTRTA